MTGRNPRALAGAALALVAAALMAAALWARVSDDEALSLTVAGHAVVLARPRALVLFACAPLLLVPAVWSITDWSPRWRVFQSALRLAFLACVILALAAPAVRREHAAVSVVALVDVSASVSTAQLGAARSFLRDLARTAAATPEARLRVARFASEVSEITPTAVERFGGAAGDDTDLALGIGLGLGLVDRDRVPRLLLLSDGRATRGDALAQAARASETGVRVFVRPLPAEERRDVAVVAMTAPDEIRPHATFELELRIVATHGGTGHLRVTRDGKPAGSARAITFGAGVTVVRWETTVDRPGTVVYRAAISDATSNTQPENDALMLAIATRPRPRALLVEAGAAGGAALLRALSAEGIDGDARTPRALARSLDGYELIVLSDVPRANLTPAQIANLERFTRNGGGLIVAGGPASFGSRGYRGSRLSALLPVREDPTAEREEATLALGLVIDRSGSMSGPKMELTKEAARGTAQMLSPEDLIAVVAFDSQAQSVVRLQKAANRQRILSDIAQIRASGGTNILPGLREAFDQLLPARARKKHVIVLSDGQSPYEGIQELVDDAAAAQVTVSAVGVGEGADQTLLQMIANRGGGRFYHTRDPASIPQIFSSETAELSLPSVVETPTRMRAGKASELLSGISLDGAPPLRGYSRTVPKKEAEVLIVTSEGDPLLARWQVGLGSAVVWTSDLSARWSTGVARWGGFSKLWAQIARGTMRRGAPNHFPVRAQLVADRVMVRVDAFGANDQPLGGLAGQLDVTVLSPSGVVGARPAVRAPLAEVVPGRYEAELRAPTAAAALLLEARLTGATGELVADGAGRLALPPARELLPEEPFSSGKSPGAELLAAIADRTGGRLVTDAASLFDPASDRTATTRPLRSPLLLLAFMLFLGDVAARRVRFRPPRPL